jgi:4-aminobutyrate aminotransferase
LETDELENGELENGVLETMENGRTTMLMRNTNMTVPEIKTELPGPVAQKLIATDEQFTSPSYTRDYPLVVGRGQGAMIEDVDGNRFLDFTSGIAVCSTGHCHPRIVDAIQRQAASLIHMSGTDFYYEPQVRLAEKLAAVAPGNSPKKVFFTNSGAESVEAAFKLARYHTRRPRVLAFKGAFHGRTMGALSLTGSKAIQRAGFAPLVPGVTHVDYPNMYRSGLDEEACTDATIRQIEELFAQTVPAEEVAAIFVEPIQGEGGYIVPPANFHRRLKELMDKHGILFIADEVQAGMGRTGKMYAMEHWGIEPDILCSAKGIASGMPLGAMIAKESVMNWVPGSHASTYGGNPICCAAALETIALLEESLINNSALVGGYLQDRLAGLMEEHEVIGDVRGKGLMIGVELVKNRETKERAVDLRNELVHACYRRGLLMLGCGPNTIRFCPPLMITKDDAETATRIFSEALREVSE